MPFSQEDTPDSAEVFISVDVETAGPHPGQYPLLSVGACLVDDLEEAFYVELQPDRDQARSEALAISGLSMEALKEQGLEPEEALRRFADWLEQVVPAGGDPVFVAFNAPFDWMFLNEYFHRYLGQNPFGYAALDMKAYYMGVTGCRWAETKMQYVSARYLNDMQLTHNALQDAQDQARLFRAMRAEARV